jgi:hypothetical protein
MKVLILLVKINMIIEEISYKVKIIPNNNYNLIKIQYFIQIKKIYNILIKIY